jgi:hypothetical protein
LFELLGEEDEREMIPITGTMLGSKMPKHVFLLKNKGVKSKSSLSSKKPQPKQKKFLKRGANNLAYAKK